MSDHLLFKRVISVMLVLALAISSFSMFVYAQEEVTTVSFSIDGTVYNVDMKFEGKKLYCRADQWSVAAACLWTFNTEQQKVLFYYDTDAPVVLVIYDDQVYITDGDLMWVPFFDVATKTGVYFTGVSENMVRGYRAKPLAVFYKDMDRMFAISKYKITEMILALDDVWFWSSSASRWYATLSSFSLKGYLDAVSGKSEQDMYDAVFVDVLKMDETLLGVVTDAGEKLKRPAKIINLLQESLDENGAFVELLKRMEFSESDIRDIVWDLSQKAYGNKTLNDLSDFYKAYEYSEKLHLLDLMEFVDDMTISLEADSHVVMAMQEVFANSDSVRIRHATEKAIGARTKNNTLAGKYTFEFLGDILFDEAIGKLEETIGKTEGMANLKKLGAEILVWGIDKTFKLTDTTNAFMYSDVYSHIQLELAEYYYRHRNDETPENGLMLHSVALLYLRTCLASWQLFEYDKTLSQSIDNATSTIKGEIANLMKYTEEELLQNGTSEETEQAIIELVSELGEMPNTLPATPIITTYYEKSCECDGTGYSYSIPQINLDSPEIDAINQEILTDYYGGDHISDIIHKCDEQDDFTIKFFDYEYSVVGDILSLAMCSEETFTDGTGWRVYIISVSEKREVTKETVLDAYGMSLDEYAQTVKDALSVAFLELWERYSDGDVESWKPYLEGMLEERNLSKAKPFFNADGKLCILGDVGIAAGAGFTQQIIELEGFEITKEQRNQLQQLLEYEEKPQNTENFDVAAKSEGVMTYEEYAAAALGSEVVIEAYVQDTQGWWFDNDAGYGKITVYAQEPAGGYFIYEMKCDEADAGKVVPGAKIKVTGYKAEWCDGIEILDATFELGEGIWTAEAMDATSLLGTEDLIKHQNKLVFFSGLTVEGVEYRNGEWGDDIYVSLSKNGATYSFCVVRYLTGPDSEVYKTIGELRAGDVIDVTGYLRWDEGIYPHITGVTVK
ncbi:MAG: hypothetical protein IKM13_01930 [Clostridia bacterium]|nr:hypothetical protein [Clostridia bacterium]